MRWLLLTALGALVLLTAGTGLVAVVVFGQIRGGEAALRNRFMERSWRLERVRTGIYLSGTVARDYFVDPEGPEADALLRQLQSLESETVSELGDYSAAQAADTASTASLRGEVIVYWRVLGLMAEVARTRRTPRMDAYFRGQLALRRENMLRIAGRIGDALQREVRDGESTLDAMYARLYRTVGLAVAFALGAGLLLSAGALRRVIRLEREARGLSAQLVQAQEAERRAIARELHDEIGQSLTGLMLEVGAAAAATESEDARSRLAAAGSVVERLVESVRRMALSLRPSMLDDLGLVPALEWQAREVGARTGLHVEVAAEDGAGELPEAHRTCIFRVAQEALANCVRHAGAGKVRIGLSREAARVALEVTDDGKGFRPGRTRGLGLMGMEERVAQLGGRLRVHSEPGRGTTITAELPV